MTVRGDLLPAAAGLAATALLAAVAYAVVDTLPHPTEGIDVAAAALQNLERIRLGGAVVRLDGRTFRVTCRSRGRVDVLTLPDGGRIVVRGTHLVPEETTLPSGRAVVIADLAGSRRLLVAELVAAARRSDVLLVGGSFVSGPTLALRLGHSKARVALVISRTSNEPLGVRYASASVRGSSVLLPAPPAGRQLASATAMRAGGC